MAERYRRRQSRSTRKRARKEKRTAELLDRIRRRHEAHKRKRDEADALAPTGARRMRLLHTQPQV